MPTSHKNPLESLPSERLRVGECVVEVPLREVVRVDGAKTRITLKSIAVLLVLAEHAGKVVSREELLETVWAGTMPTDDVVTQAITLLRKALGDDRDAPAYVETIPKSGYRLLAQVEWLPRADGASTQSERQATGAVIGGRTGRGPWLVAAALGVAALAWVTVHWSGKRESQQTPAAALSVQGDVAYTLLTSRPGPESQPALSPDGALLAYAMPPGAPEEASAIFLQAAQPTPPRQLTSPPLGHSDHLPRWSPDGRQLVFMRIDEVGGCALHLLPVSGGADREVGRCDRVNGGYDWLPDGSGLVAGLKPPAEGMRAPLSILRLATGQWQAIQYATDVGDTDFDPRFSPDGSQIAFRRHLSHSDLWSMPAQGGQPRRLTRLSGNISGWDWAPDGASLLLGFLGNPPQLYRHDMASGRTQPLGRFATGGLDVARHRAVMAFAVDEARTAMFRYPLPLLAGADPQALFASTGNDLLPSPSPDGRWLAFHSDRSREERLWLGEPDDPGQLRMVEGVSPIPRHPPQWSLDGRRLLVIGESADGVGEPGQQLYEVDVASGRVKRLAVDGVPYAAQYLPEGRLLLIVDGGAGRLSLRVVDAAGSPARVLARMDNVGEARYDADSGQVYFVRSNGPGLWRTGTDLRAPVPVDRAQPGAYWLRRWAVLDGEPFVLRTAAPTCLADWRWLGSGSRPSPGCLDRARRGVPSLAPMPSRDGKWLYMSIVVGQENSDIGLLELDSLPGAAKATH